MRSVISFGRVATACGTRNVQILSQFNFKMRVFALVFSLAAFSYVLAPAAQPPWFFAVMSDPQFGMYTDDQSFSQETTNFEFAIASANRLHPKFVVVCGDLVNRHGDPNEIAEYKRILAKLAPDIAVYSVPGNHDVGDIPTSETLDAYRRAIGHDYFTFVSGNILGVVLDSNLIRAPESAPLAAREQESWLAKTLGDAHSIPNTEIIVFQHIPYFVKSADENDGYFNIPRQARLKYLHVLEQAGVKYVFAGHLHRNAIARDGELTEIITGAVGMPLGGSLSGFRVVTAHGEALRSTWFCLAGIPNRVDLQKAPATDCPQ